MFQMLHTCSTFTPYWLYLHGTILFYLVPPSESSQCKSWWFMAIQNHWLIWTHFFIIHGESPEELAVSTMIVDFLISLVRERRAIHDPSGPMACTCAHAYAASATPTLLHQRQRTRPFSWRPGLVLPFECWLRLSQLELCRFKMNQGKWFFMNWINSICLVEMQPYLSLPGSPSP